MTRSGRSDPGSQESTRECGRADDPAKAASYNSGVGFSAGGIAVTSGTEASTSVSPTSAFIARLQQQYHERMRSASPAASGVSSFSSASTAARAIASRTASPYSLSSLGKVAPTRRANVPSRSCVPPCNSSLLPPLEPSIVARKGSLAGGGEHEARPGSDTSFETSYERGEPRPPLSIRQGDTVSSWTLEGNSLSKETARPAASQRGPVQQVQRKQRASLRTPSVQYGQTDGDETLSGGRRTRLETVHAHERGACGGEPVAGPNRRGGDAGPGDVNGVSKQWVKGRPVLLDSSLFGHSLAAAAPIKSSRSSLDVNALPQSRSQSSVAALDPRCIEHGEEDYSKYSCTTVRSWRPPHSVSSFVATAAGMLEEARRDRTAEQEGIQQLDLPRDGHLGPAKAAVAPTRAVTRSCSCDVVSVEWPSLSSVTRVTPFSASGGISQGLSSASRSAFVERCERQSSKGRASAASLGRSASVPRVVATTGGSKCSVTHVPSCSSTASCVSGLSALSGLSETRRAYLALKSSRSLAGAAAKQGGTRSNVTASESQGAAPLSRNSRECKGSRDSDVTTSGKASASASSRQVGTRAGEGEHGQAVRRGLTPFQSELLRQQEMHLTRRKTGSLHFPLQPTYEQYRRTQLGFPDAGGGNTPPADRPSDICRRQVRRTPVSGHYEGASAVLSSREELAARDSQHSTERVSVTSSANVDTLYELDNTFSPHRHQPGPHSWCQIEITANRKSETTRASRFDSWPKNSGFGADSAGGDNNMHSSTAAVVGECEPLVDHCSPCSPLRMEASPSRGAKFVVNDQGSPRTTRRTPTVSSERDKDKMQDVRREHDTAAAEDVQRAAHKGEGKRVELREQSQTLPSGVITSAARTGRGRHRHSPVSELSEVGRTAPVLRSSPPVLGGDRSLRPSVGPPGVCRKSREGGNTRRESEDCNWFGTHSRRQDEWQVYTSSSSRGGQRKKMASAKRGDGDDQTVPECASSAARGGRGTDTSGIRKGTGKEQVPKCHSPFDESCTASEGSEPRNADDHMSDTVHAVMTESENGGRHLLGHGKGWSHDDVEVVGPDSNLSAGTDPSAWSAPGPVARDESETRESLQAPSSCVSLPEQRGSACQVRRKPTRDVLESLDKKSKKPVGGVFEGSCDRHTGAEQPDAPDGDEGAIRHERTYEEQRSDLKDPSAGRLTGDNAVSGRKDRQEQVSVCPARAAPILEGQPARDNQTTLASFDVENIQQGKLPSVSEGPVNARHFYGASSSPKSSSPLSFCDPKALLAKLRGEARRASSGSSLSAECSASQYSRASSSATTSTRASTRASSTSFISPMSRTRGAALSVGSFFARSEAASERDFAEGVTSDGFVSRATPPAHGGDGVLSDDPSVGPWKTSVGRTAGRSRCTEARLVNTRENEPLQDSYSTSHGNSISSANCGRGHWSGCGDRIPCVLRNGSSKMMECHAAQSKYHTAFAGGHPLVNECGANPGGTQRGNKKKGAPLPKRAEESPGNQVWPQSAEESERRGPSCVKRLPEKKAHVNEELVELGVDQDSSDEQLGMEGDADQCLENAHSAFNEGSQRRQSVVPCDLICTLPVQLQEQYGMSSQQHYLASVPSQQSSRQETAYGPVHLEPSQVLGLLQRGAAPGDSAEGKEVVARGKPVHLFEHEDRGVRSRQACNAAVPCVTVSPDEAVPSNHTVTDLRFRGDPCRKAAQHHMEVFKEQQAVPGFDEDKERDRFLLGAQRIVRAHRGKTTVLNTTTTNVYPWRLFTDGDAERGGPPDTTAVVEESCRAVPGRFSGVGKLFMRHREGGDSEEDDQIQDQDSEAKLLGVVIHDCATDECQTKSLAQQARRPSPVKEPVEAVETIVRSGPRDIHPKAAVLPANVEKNNRRRRKKEIVTPYPCSLLHGKPHGTPEGETHVFPRATLAAPDTELAHSGRAAGRGHVYLSRSSDSVPSHLRRITARPASHSTFHFCREGTPVTIRLHQPTLTEPGDVSVSATEACRASAVAGERARAVDQHEPGWRDVAADSVKGGGVEEPVGGTETTSWEARVAATKKSVREQLGHLLEEDKSRWPAEACVSGLCDMVTSTCSCCFGESWQRMSPERQHRCGQITFWALVGALVVVILIVLICIVSVKMLRD
ncbi:transmembrane protein [Cystoisospora suis]|uniref:Transmembrane protein n=1 Tax=Cystoisospora suis TaxID=483139 RepID=A0A2C6L7I5_9APIC|nr:transmembrane protein [Cystoisospora suis]